MMEIKNSEKWENLTDFEKNVLELTYKIPEGKVSTYGQIARVLGNKYYSRAVGNALNKNPFAPKIPCHRVIKTNGQIGGFAKGSSEKEKRLKMENIIISNHKINLKKYVIDDKILLKD